MLETGHERVNCTNNRLCVCKHAAIALPYEESSAYRQAGRQKWQITSRGLL